MRADRLNVFVIAAAETTVDTPSAAVLNEFISELIAQNQGAYLTQWARGTSDRRLISGRWYVNMLRDLDITQIVVTEYSLFVFVGDYSSNMARLSYAAEHGRVLRVEIDQSGKVSVCR